MINEGHLKVEFHRGRKSGSERSVFYDCAVDRFSTPVPFDRNPIWWGLESLYALLWYVCPPFKVSFEFVNLSYLSLRAESTLIEHASSCKTSISLTGVPSFSVLKRSCQVTHMFLPSPTLFGLSGGSIH